MPLGIPEKAGGFKEDGSEVSSSYVFSAGRSNRDYGVLKRAAEDARVPLRIACPEETADGFSFTEILADCFDDDMERQLSGAFAVAVPLRDKTISSGQLVVLQAMRAGKPVVVSDNVSLRPYIREGETALVARRQEDWAGFIRMLRDDSGLARKLGEPDASGCGKSSQYGHWANGLENGYETQSSMPCLWPHSGLSV